MSFRSVPINWYTIYSTSKLDFLYSIAWLRWRGRQTGRFFLATGTLVFLKDIEFLRAEYLILKTLKMTIILINLSRSNDCYPSSAGKGSTKVHWQSRFQRYWFLLFVSVIPFLLEDISRRIKDWGSEGKMNPFTEVYDVSLHLLIPRVYNDLII